MGCRSYSCCNSSKPEVKSIKAAGSLKAKTRPDFLHGDVGDLCGHHHSCRAAIATPVHRMNHERPVDSTALKRRMHSKKNPFSFIGFIEAHGGKTGQTTGRI